MVLTDFLLMATDFVASALEILYFQCNEKKLSIFLDNISVTCLLLTNNNKFINGGKMCSENSG